ncbi:MAG: hypothetical protein ACLPQ6_03915 [Steroidobacteraceae bacterium]|jgi:hypothetical protein
MDEPGKDLLTRALGRLTTAVWALAAVLAVFVAMYIVSYVRAGMVFRNFAKNTPPVPASMRGSQGNFVDLSTLPLEKQIEAASVIVITRYRKDGDRHVCIISEILKQAPGTTFYYAVGDEFAEMSYYPKEGESHGDGQLMYFVGSPAEFRYSTSIQGDRITGLGGMPLDLFRAKLHATAK